MDTFKIPTEAKPCIADLKKLGRSGVHMAAALGESPLFGLAVVRWKASGAASLAEKARIFSEILEEVITDEMKGLDVRTGQAYFGYGIYSGQSSRDRYSAIKMMHKKRSWDEFRKEPLDRVSAWNLCMPVCERARVRRSGR